MSENRFDRDSIRAIPALLVFFVLLKAWAVAEYSLTTTGALISAAPLTVLVGAVTSYFNLVFVLLGIAAFFWLARHSRREEDDAQGPDRHLEEIVFAILVICVLAFPVPNRLNPVLLLSVTYGVSVSLVLFALWKFSDRMQRRGAHPALRSAALRPSWFVAAFAVLLLWPTLRVPWVPAEVLVLRGGAATHDLFLHEGHLRTTRYPVVFVLSENGDWTTLLDVESRSVTRVRTSSILHRQVCHYPGQPTATVPLAEYVFGERYHSSNRGCRTLVKNHSKLLDPVVAKVERTPS